MPYRKVLFEKGQPVHIISGAVVDVFRNKDDCYRGIFQFYAANLGQRGTSVKREDAIKAGQALLYGEKIPAKFIIKEHSPLVSLLDFSFVINHLHFYLVPNVDNAVPILMQKFKNGFAKFFNLFHNRRNTVFGNPYKGIVVETELQSHAVSRYVSIVNPLDVFQPGWREEGLNDWQKALRFLKSYEFSSFPDRIGKRYAKILAPKDVFEKYTWGTASKREQAEFREFIKEFLKEKSSLPRNLFLEC